MLFRHLKELNMFFRKWLFVVGFISIWVFIFPSQVQSQQIECGSVPTMEQMQHMIQLRNKLHSVQFKSTDTIFIPVKAHVIRRSNGTGGMLPSQLYTEIGRVNTVYAPSGVQFYMCDTINYIDNDDAYDFKRNTDESITADIHDQENILNVYFAGELYRTSNGGQDTSYLCGYAYFPPGPDRIFMSNSCATNGSTLAHEIGHYLGLLHTHDSSNGDELADGSNCAFAGDLFCDTPADPNISGDVNSSCIYTGSDTDANGDAYNPDPTNIMSYSRKSCRDNFSAEQISMIYLTAFAERDYLIEPLITDFSFTANSVDVAFNDLSAGATSTNWDFGDGNTSGLSNPVYGYSDTGLYSICLTAQNTCVVKTQCELISLTCNTLEATFTYEDPEISDLSIEFNTPYSDSSMVFWDFGDGQTATGANPVYTYSQPGTFSVMMIVENRCGADTTSQLITVDAITYPIGIDSPEKLVVNTYPNPAANRLYLDASLTASATVSVMGIDGRVVLSTFGEVSHVNIDKLPAGLWLLVIQDKGRVYQGRFIKMDK